LGIGFAIMRAQKYYSFFLKTNKWLSFFLVFLI